MSCFTLGYLQALVIQCIILAALIACIQLLIPWLGSLTWPIIAQIVTIILWTIVAIIVVYIIFSLLSCLVGGGGFSGVFPKPR